MRCETIGDIIVHEPPYPAILARGFGELTIRMPQVASTHLSKAWYRDREDGRGPDCSDLPRRSHLCAVRADGPVGLRRAVTTCARYFRREFGYDFVLYQERDEERSARAFVWYDEGFYQPTVPVWGACCFRWRTWKGCHPVWALQWIWLHPYLRGQGLLTATWPYFLQRFGWFDVEPPYSPVMGAFLRKAGWVRPFVWADEATGTTGQEGA